MEATNGILALGRRCGIEEPHAAQVAKLALALHDGFFPAAGAKAGDRSLLFAAAWLHDIGYAGDPENHAEAGVRLLLDNPVEGAAPRDWRAVAALVLLHRRNWRAALDHDLLSGAGKRQRNRILGLAAALRIADGLDHGHIQDARILSCRRGRKMDKVVVACGGYPGNVGWAQGKADLWEAVFHRPFRLQAGRTEWESPFEGIVQRGDPAAAAARRILFSQYGAMRDNLPGVVDGRDLECLHDYRVALRRFRAALGFFRPLLRGTSAQALEKRLGQWSDELGPPRDAHALYQFFQSLEPGLPGGAGERFLGSLAAGVAEANRWLAARFASEESRRLALELSRFLRVELPALERAEDAALPCGAFAGKRLAKLLRQARGAEPAGLRRDAERLHAARKLLRRARYCAEFAAPALGKRTARMAKALQNAAGALGDVRDAGILLQRLRPADCGAAALEALRRRRRAAWRRFSRGWEKLAGL